MADRKNVQQSRRADKTPADLGTALINISASMTCTELRLRGLAEIAYMIHDGAELEGEALRNTAYTVYDALRRGADEIKAVTEALVAMRAKHEATR